VTDGVGQQLKKIGSRFAFEFFLEIWKPRIIETLREWLSGVSVEDLRKVVSEDKFPDTGSLNLSAVTPYAEYLEKISVERVLEDYLAPARPDLVQELQEMGMQGATWLVKFRLHLLEQVKRAGEEVKTDLVQATCDACGKSWPVPRAEFDSIEECPFCHTRKDEPPAGKVDNNLLKNDN